MPPTVTNTLIAPGPSLYGPAPARPPCASDPLPVGRQATSESWSIDPYCRWLTLRRPHGKKQAIQLRHEKRGAGARHSRNVVGTSKSRIRDLEYVHEPVAAADIDATALLIQEEIVAVAAGFRSRGLRSIGHRQGGKLRWLPEHHKDPLPPFVEGHWEISARPRSRPSRDGRSAIAVHDDHRTIIRQIHEDSFPAALETEAFGMGRQLDVGELAIALDIDDRESAATVAHEDTLLVSLDADVVCVIPELDRRPFLKARAVKDPERPVPAARDVECVPGAHIADALRFSKALQPLQSPLCSQIDHAHGSVSELRHEQTLARKIHRHVIDSSADLAERNFCFEAERRRFLATCRRDGDRAERSQDCAYPSRQWCGRPYQGNLHSPVSREAGTLPEAGRAEAPQSCIAQQSASSSDPVLIGRVLAFVQEPPKLLPPQALSLALLRARSRRSGNRLGRGSGRRGRARGCARSCRSLRDLHAIEGSAQPSCQLLRIVVPPEMHEEQARLVVEHVVVDGRHFDP